MRESVVYCTQFSNLYTAVDTPARGCVGYENPLLSTPGTNSPNRPAVCVFITAVPITKLFACVGGGTMEDMCYERLRAEACVN